MVNSLTGMLLGFLVSTASKGFDGYIGNKGDKIGSAAVKSLVDYIRKDELHINHDLEDTVLCCFLSAQRDIAKQCADELASKAKHIGEYRSLPEDKLDFDWLNKKISSLKANLKNSQGQTTPIPLKTLAEIETLVLPSGELNLERLEAVKKKLVASATSDPKTPQCFLDKANSDLIDYVNGYFSHEIKTNEAVRSIFTVQLLAQVNETLQEQRHSLTDLEQNFRKYADHLPEMHQDVREILDLLKSPERNLTEEKSSHNVPHLPIWNVTIGRNGFFTGREIVLDELHQALQNGNEPQALFGLGGVGKTQTAVEYAYRNGHEYDAVFWVKAETESALVSGFVEIARLLNLPLKDAKDENETVQDVRRWLDQNEKWLLLCDNADDPAILKDFLPRDRMGHILLTSRAQNFDDLGIAHTVPINEMLPDEALAFLLKRTGREDASEEERHCAEELVTELGYLALAIEQAGAYIAAKQAGISAYLNSYRNRKLQVLERSKPKTGDYPESVATTWLINFEQVEAASEAAADILRFSAFLNPDDIPLELLILGRTALTPAIQEALGDGEDELAIDELLAPLTRYSLIRKDVNSQSYSIHRLVQEVGKDILDEDKRKQWSEQVVRAVQKAFPTDIEYTTWVLCERLLAQAESAYKIVEKFQFEFEEAGYLLNQTGYYLYERARYEQAEPLYMRTLALVEKVLGPEHPNVATILNNLAGLYDSQGRYEQAEPLHERALAIREKVLGPEHPDVAQSLNNLALLYDNQGRYEQAEPLHERALAILEKVLGPEHPDVAQSLNNLAELYRNQGRYKQAEPLFKRALAIREKVLGSEHPDVAQSLNNLALWYFNQGRYEQAEPLYNRALAIYEKVLGPEHPKVSTSLNNLALLYKSQDRYEQAEPLYERALAIVEKVLGPEHPVVAQNLNNLAELYKSQGRYERAEPLYERALAIYEKVLDAEHPDVATSLNNLAMLYFRQGRYEQAELLFNRALAIREKVLGPEHPRVSTSLNNLAGLYDSQGRYKQAEPLFKRALAIVEKVLGPGHPNTMTARRNYTALLKKTKKKGFGSA
jgi:tetratricopeptide (TPR) repeat protein